MSKLECQRCGGHNIKVVFTDVNPKKKFSAEQRFVDAGFKRPFITRVRVCKDCGATYQTIETIINWGIKRESTKTQKKDHNQTAATGGTSDKEDT